MSVSFKQWGRYAWPAAAVLVVLLAIAAAGWPSGSPGVLSNLKAAAHSATTRARAAVAKVAHAASAAGSAAAPSATGARGAAPAGSGGSPSLPPTAAATSIPSTSAPGALAATSVPGTSTSGAAPPSGMPVPGSSPGPPVTSAAGDPVEALTSATDAAQKSLAAAQAETQAAADLIAALPQPPSSGAVSADAASVDGFRKGAQYLSDHGMTNARLTALRKSLADALDDKNTQSLKTVQTQLKAALDALGQATQGNSLSDDQQKAAGSARDAATKSAKDLQDTQDTASSLLGDGKTPGKLENAVIQFYQLAVNLTGALQQQLNATQLVASDTSPRDVCKVRTVLANELPAFQQVEGLSRSLQSAVGIIPSDAGTFIQDKDSAKLPGQLTSDLRALMGGADGQGVDGVVSHFAGWFTSLRRTESPSKETPEGELATIIGLTKRLRLAQQLGSHRRHHFYSPRSLPTPAPAPTAVASTPASSVLVPPTTATPKTAAHPTGRGAAQAALSDPPATPRPLAPAGPAAPSPGVAPPAGASAGSTAPADDPVELSDGIPLDTQPARFLVADLKAIDTAWQPLAAQLQGIDAYAAPLARATSALGELRVSRELLEGALQALDEVQSGDPDLFVNEQVRLFYFTDVSRLLKALNPAAYVLNPDDARFQKQADDLRQQLLSQETLLASSLGALSSARRRSQTIGSELQLATTAAQSTAQQLSQATGALKSLQLVQASAQSAYDAKKDDTTVDDATKQQLKTALDKANQDVAAQQNIVTDATTAKGNADQQVSALNTEQGALPSKVTDAQNKLTAAESTVNDLRASVTSLASGEAEGFAFARDHTLLWFAPARAASHDPARRVMMYAYEDSKTLFIRGKREDVQRVMEIIAGFDRPAPQARVTLWTLQLNGAENPPNRINNAIKEVDSQLRELRGSIVTTQELFREALNNEVNRVSEIHRRALANTCCAVVDPRLARYFFYAPEVSRRLGFVLPLPAEFEQIERVMNDRSDLEEVVDLLQAGERTAGDPANKSTLDQRRSSIDLRLRLAKLALQRATDDLRHTQMANATDRMSIKALTQEAERELGGILQEEQELSRQKTCDGLTSQFTSWAGGVTDRIPRELNTDCSDEWLVGKLACQHSHPCPAPQVISDVDYLTRWTLPDPAHATTLGEMFFVASLARRSSRMRILTDFIVALGQAYPRQDGGHPMLEHFGADIATGFPGVATALGGPTAGRSSVVPRPVFLTALRDALDTDTTAVDDDEMTANQHEIVLALEAKARTALTGVVQGLIQRIGSPWDDAYDRAPQTAGSASVAAQQDPRTVADTAAMDDLYGKSGDQLRRRYLPMIGWLYSQIGGPTPGMPDPKAGWTHLGLFAMSGDGAYCDLPGATTDSKKMEHLRKLDRNAWNFVAGQAQGNPLAFALPRVAAADEMIKRLIILTEDDMEHYFLRDTLDNIQRQFTRQGVNLGVVQRTSILATNRLTARVDPQASGDVEVQQAQDLLQEATQLAQIAQQYKNDRKSTAATAGGVAAAASSIVGHANPLSATGIGLVASLLGYLTAQPKDPPGDIYSLNAGNVFKITPIFDPSGQALRFQFDHVTTVNVREPDGTTNRQIPRIEQHTINTEVQLSNLELREISRFENNMQVGTPSQRTGGIPFLRTLPVLKEIPLVGYYVRQRKSAPLRQESLIFAQTTVYPTVAEIVDLLVESPSGPLTLIEQPDAPMPGYLDRPVVSDAGKTNAPPAAGKATTASAQ